MIQVGQGALSLDEFAELVFNHKEAALDPVALKKVNTNFEFLRKFSSNKLIYGINTGFGPMAQYKVSEENILQLQYNLIRSHSSGSGKLIPARLSRALTVSRLNSFMQGFSGVHPETVELLKEMINHDICPCIYEH